MDPFPILFTLASIGIAETSYLIKKRKAAERPICPMGGGCEIVLTSKYNRLFGAVHNDVLGFLFYKFVAIFLAVLVIDGTWNLFGFTSQEIFTQLTLFLNLLIASATLMSLGLIYIQWRILRAWCFWCLMSAFTIFAMGGILMLYQL
jgi:uncharacterized membrane protein